MKHIGKEQDEHDVAWDKELDDIKKALLDSDEDITLPQTLSAQALFAKMDLADATNDSSCESVVAKDNKVSFIHRMKPILAYAAVFVAIVTVYYSAGLDQGAIQKQGLVGAGTDTVSPATMMMDEGTEDQSDHQPEGTEDVQEYLSSSVAPMSPSEDGLVTEMTEGVPIVVPRTGRSLLQSNNSQDNQKPVVDNQTIFDFYEEIAFRLDQSNLSVDDSDEMELEENTEDSTKPKTYKYKAHNDDYLFLYENVDDQFDRILIHDERTGKAISSFDIGDGEVVEILAHDQGVIVIEERENNHTLYQELCLIDPLDELKECDINHDDKSIQVTTYQVIDPQEPVVLASYMQEGSYVSHQWQKNELIIATEKNISNAPYSPIRLCTIAPLIAYNDEPFTMVDTKNVHIYPKGSYSDYIILSLYDVDAPQMPPITSAVLGDDMTVKMGNEAIFILSSQLQSEGNGIFAKYEFGTHVVELR